MSLALRGCNRRLYTIAVSNRLTEGLWTIRSWRLVQICMSVGARHLEIVSGRIYFSAWCQQSYQDWHDMLVNSGCQWWEESSARFWSLRRPHLLKRPQGVTAGIKPSLPHPFFPSQLAVALIRRSLFVAYWGFGLSPYCCRLYYSMTSNCSWPQENLELTSEWQHVSKGWLNWMSGLWRSTDHMTMLISMKGSLCWNKYIVIQLGWYEQNEMSLGYVFDCPEAWKAWYIVLILWNVHGNILKMRSVRVSGEVLAVTESLYWHGHQVMWMLLDWWASPWVQMLLCTLWPYWFVSPCRSTLHWSFCLLRSPRQVMCYTISWWGSISRELCQMHWLEWVNDSLSVLRSFVES